MPIGAHDGWYYSLFVKLVDANGATFELVRSVEHGPLIRGEHWATGDFILSAQSVTIPDGAAPGEARLEVSLYDARRGQNAAYFDPARPGSVILVRTVPLRIR